MAIAFMDYMIALRASGLSGPVRSVALWIASRCSNGWSVSLDLIASDSGYSRSTVKRAIDDLEAMGWLTREPDKVKGNSYELLIPFGSKVQGEPSIGSGRTYEKVQSEPTYIRTKQEHKNNKNLACAREEDAATIKHSNLNEGLLARWVRELVKVPEAKEEILKLSFQKSPGEVYQAMFVTSLYTSEALFERFRPWFVRLQSEGRL